MIPTTNAIAIFDSGIGGITIAKEIHRQLPHERLIYLADSAFAPYGDSSNAFITERCQQIINWLLKQQVKAIVIACNTATVNAIEILRQQFTLPIIGVEPAIKPAALASKSKHIGLLVTQATANNPRFLQLVNQHSNGCQVHIQACPGLVEIVEQDQAGSPECLKLLRQYLSPLLAHQIDHLVLGCTHYPVLSEPIQQLIGSSVQLMETAKPVTQQLIRRLEQNNLLAPKHLQNWQHFYTTQYSQQQQTAIEHILLKKINLQTLEASL